MHDWAGFFGEGDIDTLKGILGRESQTCTGVGFGLGVCDPSRGSATLCAAEIGQVTVTTEPYGDGHSSATVDPSGPTLILTTDTFGFYGVYFTLVDETLWFATDLVLLQRISGVSNVIDVNALHAYLSFSYVPTPLSLVSGISRLPAGTRLIVSSEGKTSERIAPWRESETLDLNEEKAVHELQIRLRASVENRVGTAREVGVFLSGGLDSSLIAAILVDLGLKVKLFTIDFGPPFNIEVPFARQVAEHLGQQLNIVPAGPKQIKAGLLGTAAALEQPFGDGVTVPLYLLGQAAAQHVDVVFNGEGGDQLFGGWTNKPMISAELYGGPDFDREEAYLRTFRRFYGLTDVFYTPEARTAVQNMDMGEWVRPILNDDGFSSLMHRLRAANLYLKGAQNIAPRATQLAVAHGLELKSPFFDQGLAEWTFTLPSEWFLRGASEKHLLKLASEQYLPSDVTWREKRGMGVPTTEWCLGYLKREVRRRLTPPRLKRDGWFESSAVSALCKGEEQPGEYRRRRIGEKLWVLFMLQLWLETRECALLWPTTPPSSNRIVKRHKIAKN